MTESKWQILLADDDKKICEQVKKYLEHPDTQAADGNGFAVTTLTSFSAVLTEIEARQIDILVLDIRLGPTEPECTTDEAGIVVLDGVRSRAFIPVVFYTALPEKVEHLESDLIYVIEKTKGVDAVHSSIQEILATGLPKLNRALLRHIKEQQRDYMWGFVTANWNAFRDTTDRISLAHLMARRLANSLSGLGIAQLAQHLGSTNESQTQDDRIHPMQYYILPPIDGQPPMSGDIYQNTINGEPPYWVLLTPSCDLIPGREKADWTLCAPCDLLKDQSEYANWQDKLPNPSAGAETKLKDLLKNNPQGRQSGRFHFLPGALTLPHMLVDLQKVTTIARSQLANLERIASLDSPFSEALLAQFTRYFGRIGIPDLDIESITARLKFEAAEGNN